MTDTPDIVFTPPCLGSVGSQPFLHDVQAQLNENFHAKREGREARVLPIACGFCGGYHESNQLDAASVFKGTEFEEYAYNRIAPRPDGVTYIPNDNLRAAHMAVNGGIDIFANADAPGEVEETEVKETESDGSER